MSRLLDRDMVQCMYAENRTCTIRAFGYRILGGPTRNANRVVDRLVVVVNVVWYTWYSAHGGRHRSTKQTQNRDTFRTANNNNKSRSVYLLPVLFITSRARQPDNPTAYINAWPGLVPTSTRTAVYPSWSPCPKRKRRTTVRKVRPRQ